MKELTKKVVEAGLVPRQSLQLLEMWKCIPHSDGTEILDHVVGEKTQEQLLEFVEQIAELLEDEQNMVEMRETELDLRQVIVKNPRRIRVYPKVSSSEFGSYEMVVGKDRSGRLVFPVGGDGRMQESACRRGSELDLDGARYMITHVEPRYEGEKLSYYLCNIVSEEP